jgi:signal transduction histidine kinase
MMGAVLLSVFFLLFTNYLVHELSKKELAEVEKIAEAYKHLNDPDQKDYTDILRVIREASIPRIVVGENGNIIYCKNLDSLRSKDTTYLMSELKSMRFYNDPIRIQYGKDNVNHIDIYYKEQTAITLLRYFPYVQLILIGLFLTISYVAFNTSRMYEQNKVWVGMAKETAHQIGTPLSSLMAWVEYLKINPEPPGEEVLSELEKDIQRLEIITERFSKIGSTPELKQYNIYDVIHESIDYLRNRISNKVSLELTPDSDHTARAMLNKNLFSWVIENLSKNAVDAMPGKGEITYHIKQGRHNVYIDVKDTGKGVPRSNWKQIFKPGFTTKKRGWGLGLSLSKRIVENYHKGEIFIKESEPGKGTTFRIKLKKVEA